MNAITRQQQAPTNPAQHQLDDQNLDPNLDTASRTRTGASSPAGRQPETQRRGRKAEAANCGQ